MERYDAIVIGAGPAGSAAAISLAREKMKVLLVERGKTPGQKNVFGGRIYSYPLPNLVPEWRDDCPVERFVTKDCFAFMTPDQSLLVQFESPRLASGKAASFTALRSKFDSWLAQKAEGAGATLITEIRVDDLWMEGGRTKGIIAGNDRMGADVVIAADGVVSKFTQRAGLRGDMPPQMVSVGVKETIGLPPETIQDRFGIAENEGAAYVLAGQPSGFLHGGGFIYTNKDSVSLGLVVSSGEVSANKVEVHSLQEKFKRHPTIDKLLRGGKVIEYSSHMIPELGVATLRLPYADNFLAAGDAAGFLINNGYTFRGVDLAIASGKAAAEAVKVAARRGDFSEVGLAAYGQILRREKVLTDLATFRKGPPYMTNPRLYSLYPKLLCDIIERIYTIDGSGKKRAIETVLDEIKAKDASLFAMLRDLMGGALTM